MREWSIRLTGHAFDLEELSDHFHSPERNVTKDEDDHYYLSSTDFDSMADDQAVHERALELVELMNRAAKFRAGESFRAVEFDGVSCVDEEGNRHRIVYSSAKMEGRSRISARPTVIRAGTSTNTLSPPSEAESMATIAERDDRVADALRYFAKGDYPNLYKAWEVVGEAVNSEHNIIKKGWATKKTKDRFTRTAQSRKVLGDEARHAIDKQDPPKNPMPLDEARAFVKSVMEAWTKTL